MTIRVSDSAKRRAGKGASALALALSVVAGCDEPTTADPFPILATRPAGGFALAFDSSFDPDSAGVRLAAIDVLSPLTIIDRVDASPLRRSTTLRLLAPPSPGAPTLLTRASFDTAALFLHPCAAGAPCSIGAPGTPTEIGGVIGADTLQGHAIRFEPDTGRMFVLDELAGSNAQRDQVCDAPLPAPFFGGGTLLVGDTELTFPGLRLALDVCLMPTPTVDRPLDPIGVDASMVMSTAIGLSILGEARYEQYRRAYGGEPLSALPPGTVLLPSGPVTGKLASIASLDLVSGSTTWTRGPCRGVYASRFLTRGLCGTGVDGVPAEQEDCPCGTARFCDAPAVVELAPAAPIQFVVVPDTHPVLQALRAELRPARPEVDGILGMNALAGSVLDVDYPNNRAVVRCVPPAADCVPDPAAVPACTVRPTFRNAECGAAIESCVAAARCEAPPL